MCRPSTATRRPPVSPGGRLQERDMATEDTSIPGRVQPWLGMIKHTLTILLLAYGVLRALGIA